MTAPRKAKAAIRNFMLASIVVVLCYSLQADALDPFRCIQRPQQRIRRGTVAERRSKRRVYRESLARGGQRHQSAVAGMEIQCRPDDDLWIMPDSDADLDRKSTRLNSSHSQIS